MSSYRLDAFNFITAEIGQGGPPRRVRRTSRVIERENVDGAGFAHGGIHGEEFILSTCTDVLDQAAAETLETNYLNVVNTIPLALVWAGVNYQTAYSVVYHVTDCRVTRKYKSPVICGGLVANSNYIVEAEWKLVPIPVVAALTTTTTTAAP